jgi:hypothetical protein
VQGGEAGTGAATEIEHPLRFDAYVIEPLEHATADFALQHRHFVVGRCRARKVPPHLALINELRRCFIND